MLWLKWHPGHYVALNQPQQPVCRVSWDEARAFCRLAVAEDRQEVLACQTKPSGSGPAGREPTRRGASAHGPPISRSSRTWPTRRCWISAERPPWRRSSRSSPSNPSTIKQVVAAPVGSYQPNAWGLYDMHGNVAEWTASADLPYPFRADDPRHRRRRHAEDVRGGSWRDRADLSRSGCRTSYRPWQRVFNVGFRVVCEAE